MILRLAALSLVLSCLPAAAQDCASRLFVSGWNSTVHVYDACTGQYLRDLDSRERLAGAMAVRLGPDGLIYAVAELGGAVHKYRNNDTFDYLGIFAARRREALRPGGRGPGPRVPRARCGAQRARQRHDLRAC